MKKILSLPAILLLSVVVVVFSCKKEKKYSNGNISEQMQTDSAKTGLQRTIVPGLATQCFTTKWDRLPLQKYSL